MCCFLVEMASCHLVDYIPEIAHPVVFYYLYILCSAEFWQENYESFGTGMNLLTLGLLFLCRRENACIGCTTRIYANCRFRASFMYLNIFVFPFHFLLLGCGFFRSLLHPGFKKYRQIIHNADCIIGQAVPMFSSNLAIK